MKGIVISLFALALFASACVDSDPPSPTIGTTELCKVDSLTGMCPGVAEQAAEQQAKAEAAQQENVATSDLSIGGECSHHGTQYTCVVNVTALGHSASLLCSVTISDGVVTGGECFACDDGMTTGITCTN